MGYSSTNLGCAPVSCAEKTQIVSKLYKYKKLKNAVGITQRAQLRCFRIINVGRTVASNRHTAHNRYFGNGSYRDIQRSGSLGNGNGAPTLERNRGVGSENGNGMLPRAREVRLNLCRGTLVVRQGLIFIIGDFY